MIKSNFFYKILVLVLSMVFVMNSFGQIINQDSIQIVKQDSIYKETLADTVVGFVPSPRKAAIYSAVLPGLGQAYNKKYWKIPLIYIGLGTMGYFFHWNNGEFKIMRQAYADLDDGIDNETNSYEDLEAYEYYDLTNSTELTNFKTAVEKQMNYYRRNRDLLLICMVGFYGLNIIDANVDAHLFDFDMSDDLTFNWEPMINYGNKFTTYGINCTFTF